MKPTVLVRVIADIAETASETLELQEVFDRVATSVREVIPIDNMGVVRILEGDRAVVHATTVPCKAQHAICSPPMPLSAWSPNFRPRPEPMGRIDDARVELDTSYPMDANIVAGGVRSAMWCPFSAGDRFLGGVWLASYRPHAFNDEHQTALVPIAAILGSAVEHWRIWDAERRRRERLDRLETIVAPLEDALDVREVFDRISAAAQEILPHRVIGLTEVDAESAEVRIVAIAGDTSIAQPDGPVHLTSEEDALRLRDHEIVRDMRAEIPPSTERNRALLATGMRSWLRVPVRQWGEVRGSLLFLHDEPGRYDTDDVEVATRLADRIALARSHHRLAEEARIASQERERAERLEATVRTLTRELEARAGMRVAGESRAWKDLLLQVGRVAPSDTTVLVTGESGTGKEVVSSLIHEGSPRREGPFVAINCAALPEQLLESELFGHEAGAFTGAVARKIGRIEQAAGGTLFLDEIAEMSPFVQAKFLRVLQEREFQRLGGTKTLRADVRIVAATNRELSEEIAAGRFREDLYYRLNVFAIHIPPLRERPDDILLLAKTFLDDLGPTMGRPAAGFSRDAREWMLSYPWPGNARELRNAVERAILVCDGGLITREHLPPAIVRPRAHGTDGLHRNGVAGIPLPPTGVDLAAVDRGYVEEALRRAAGNKSKAARLLGLSRSQLYSRLEKYRLS